MSQNWKKIKVSDCETHHLINNQPLYPQRYLHVLKFHEPGLAPVKNTIAAFHILEDGKPAYQRQFLAAFGFYEGFAAVQDSSGWYHVDTNGEACYQQRYNWC